MITVISGTNRKDSTTLGISKFCHEYLSDKVETKLLDLQHLDPEIISPDIYDDKPSSVDLMETEYLKPAEKFLFIMPEYNGGVPGILKYLIDITDIKACWYYKKAAMIGLASGRAGNLRGMDHMRNMMSYLKTLMMPDILPISSLRKEYNLQEGFVNPKTEAVVKDHLDKLIKF